MSKLICYVQQLQPHRDNSQAQSCSNDTAAASWSYSRHMLVSQHQHNNQFDRVLRRYNSQPGGAVIGPPISKECMMQGHLLPTEVILLVSIVALLAGVCMCDGVKGPYWQVAQAFWCSHDEHACTSALFGIGCGVYYLCPQQTKWASTKPWSICSMRYLVRVLHEAPAIDITDIRLAAL